MGIFFLKKSHGVGAWIIEYIVGIMYPNQWEN